MAQFFFVEKVRSVLRQNNFQAKTDGFAFLVISPANIIIGFMI
jgi:hypothetical protein